MFQIIDYEYTQLSMKNIWNLTSTTLKHIFKRKLRYRNIFLFRDFVVSMDVSVLLSMNIWVCVSVLVVGTKLLVLLCFQNR